jgi:diaminopimelate decarboxylase
MATDTATTHRRGWPEHLTTSPSGGLVFDGCDLLEVARSAGTPVWAISRSQLESNFTRLRDGFQSRYSNCEIAYSMKVNNSLAMIRILHRLGAKLDCHPEYEYIIALHAGVPAEDIILNGNGKSDRALRAAANIGVRQVNIDSPGEISRLNEIAAELGVRVRCALRIALGYRRVLEEDPHYEPMLRLGGGKVGVNVANGQAIDAVGAIIDASNLDFVGLHHHSGFGGQVIGHNYSVERELMHNRENTREVCEFANEVRRRYGASCARLDLGGGFRTGESILLATPGAGSDVAFYPVPSVEEYADAVFGTLEEVLEFDEPPLVQFESGGHQAGDAVILLASVCDVKDVPGPNARRYVMPDANMLQFVHRGMSAWAYPILLADRPDAPVEDDWVVEVAGQTCMYDSIAEEIRMPDVHVGDTLALLQQGAYCEVMSTQMNAFPRPAVVMLHDGKMTEVKRRESPAEVWSRNSVPSELWPV